MRTVILEDTREQIPWSFEIYGFEQERHKLQTGDYIIKDSNYFVFERKRSSGELAINLGSKWKQFHEELKRMQDYVVPYIICEFPLEYLDTFPVNSGIPKYKWQYMKMNPFFLKKRLFESCEKYGIQVLFFNSSQEAQEEVYRIILEYQQRKSVVVS